MAATTYVRSIEQVARKLNEEQDFIEVIASNDDNLTYGNIVGVQIGEGDCITALTDHGIEELRDMLSSARVSIDQWHSFLEDFIDDPKIIDRVKKLRLR